ncbi:histidine kinase dimerization/phosphoacceptor domain-containing protein [Actinosynnema sp. NPDC050436]|uniref:histidine kinase dimerization/phosphoacceptor domain-containing protein n=1 Tax=Actinosynnema sp. NPDC050436 TaxID=3155659 RepID=UPI0033C93974
MAARLADPGAPGRPSPRGYRDPATWREVGYTALLVTLAPLVYGGAFLLAGLPLVHASAPLVPATGHAALARALLPGGRELFEVTRSRARLVDAFDAGRRRIERDLHDGAQEKLVSLTVRLGIARLDVPEDSPAHRNVVDAHEQAEQLMADLRELVRGIHPPQGARRSRPDRRAGGPGRPQSAPGRGTPTSAGCHGT